MEAILSKFLINSASYLPPRTAGWKWTVADLVRDVGVVRLTGSVVWYKAVSRAGLSERGALGHGCDGGPLLPFPPHPFFPIPSPFPIHYPSFPSPPLPSSFPLPSSPAPSVLPSPSRGPTVQLGGLVERCKLPQRVRTEPGRQTVYGAFWAKKSASAGW